jgi:hypothetical protein
MSTGNKPYALGTDTYTLGDVLVTNLMSRLITDPKFFKIAVMDVPVLKTYWERMQARPSYKDANQHQHKLWSLTKVHMVLFFNIAFLAAIIFGILSIFHEQIGIYQHNWYLWAIGCFVGVTIMLFAWLGNKSRKIWNNHLEVVKKVDSFNRV